jgi:hypothetical protein
MIKVSLCERDMKMNKFSWLYYPFNYIMCIRWKLN